MKEFCLMEKSTGRVKFPPRDDVFIESSHDELIAQGWRVAKEGEATIVFEKDVQ